MHPCRRTLRIPARVASICKRMWHHALNPAQSLSHHHACHLISIGPVYSPRTLTPKAQGPMGDAPQYSFGNSKRFLPSTTGGDPGPGQYPQNCTRVGTGMLGDAPKYGFGTSAQREANTSPRHTRSSTGPRCVGYIVARSPATVSYTPMRALRTRCYSPG